MTYVGAAKGRYGDILYWNRDLVISSGIAAYGEYFESEVDVFRLYVNPGDFVVDCGANIGAHTMALAALVGQSGAVMSIEPQRPMFQVMCANAILNGYLNVFPIWAAAGLSFNHKRFITPDYSLPNSYGGYETTYRAEDAAGEVTRIERLDALCFSLFNRPASFIKIDVEGSEREAIRGASALLKRDRPVLYVENDRPSQSKELIRAILEYDYSLYWHVARFYNPDNLMGRPDDMCMHHYGWVGGKINGASLMLICLPKEKQLPLPPGARPVRADDEYPPFDGETNEPG